MSAQARTDALRLTAAVDRALRSEGVTRATHPKTLRAVYLVVTAIEGFAIQDVPQVDEALHWIVDLLEGRVVAITDEKR